MSTNKEKLKLAIYWGAACGGCCVSVLDVHEKILDIAALADIVFWPIATDFKYKDVEAMADKSIDLTLFNGAVRNSENEHVAKLLRQKSKVMVAYGSCACSGGIPGLANFSSKEELMRRVYEECESNDNPNKVRPQPHNDVKEGKLEIPTMYNDVMTLNQVIDVDYYLPGCPPQSERLVEVFMLIAEGKELPPKGSVVGATDRAQCEDCERKKSTTERKVKRFYRPWQIQDDGETCFMEQGLICMGSATRAGCGVRCVKGNSPCGGCYGPPSGIIDPGAKILSAVSTLIDSIDEKEIQEAIDTIDDPAGTFYKFSLPGSILRRKMN